MTDTYGACLAPSHRLMYEALEAAEEVGRLQKPFVAGINRGSTASQEVIQEASDRLHAAQQRWWDLRKRALAAVRADSAVPSGGSEVERLRTVLAQIATQATQSIDTQLGGQILRQIEVMAREALKDDVEGEIRAHGKDWCSASCQLFLTDAYRAQRLRYSAAVVQADYDLCHAFR